MRKMFLMENIIKRKKLNLENKSLLSAQINNQLSLEID
jgi:hypothetical protein